MEKPRYDDSLVADSDEIMKAWPHAKKLWRRLGDEVTTHINGRLDACVVDIGCGKGSLVSYLPPCHLDLVDCSKVVESNLVKIANNRKNTNIYLKDANEFLREANPGSYDVVLSSWLYHNLSVSSRSQYLSLAHRALKPNGMLAFVDKFLPDSLLQNIDDYNGLIAQINNCVSEPAKSAIIAHERDDYRFPVYESGMRQRLLNSYESPVVYRIGRDALLTAIKIERKN